MQPRPKHEVKIMAVLPEKYMLLKKSPNQVQGVLLSPTCADLKNEKMSD